MQEPLTHNGRPQRIGRLYCEHNYETREDVLKICTGYCPKCHAKIGVSRQQLEELVDEMPSKFRLTIGKLLMTKIIVPKWK